MENSLTKYVNTPMDNELVKKLDAMVEKKESTRAQFIRLLVKQAWEQHEAEQFDREIRGLKLLDAKTRNGKKAIKTIKAEQS